ncbi:MAG TPA: hypothetical protein VLT33_52120, partial [Labilithrix sp.]|nr:hypothetical protein [Labilithrix sp.]
PCCSFALGTAPAPVPAAPPWLPGSRAGTLGGAASLGVAVAGPAGGASDAAGVGAFCTGAGVADDEGGSGEVVAG